MEQNRVKNFIGHSLYGRYQITINPNNEEIFAAQ
jgi:hypothetical protein